MFHYFGSNNTIALHLKNDSKRKSLENLEEKKHTQKPMHTILKI